MAFKINFEYRVLLLLLLDSLLMRVKEMRYDNLIVISLVFKRILGLDLDPNA